MAIYTVTIERDGQQFEVDIEKNEAPLLQKAIGEKAYNILNLPQKTSQEGLNLLTNLIPKPTITGNLPLDIVKGTPRIAAETLSETAPSFISPESIAATGILGSSKIIGQKAVKPMLRYAGQQAENFSNVVSGSLERAYNDASLIFSKSKAAAGKLYQGTTGLSDIEKQLTDEILTHKEIIEKATELANNKTLSPAGAKIARQSVDALYKSKQYGKQAIIEKRTFFDNIAKQSEQISEADKAYRDAVTAESLRHLFPQNKTGGASPFRIAIGQAFSLLPGGEYLKYAALPATSPIIQGLAATSAGLIGRRIISPIVNIPKRYVTTATALLNKINELRNNERLNPYGQRY